MSTERTAAAYDNGPQREAELPQHTGTVQELPLEREMRGKRERTEAAVLAFS